MQIGQKVVCIDDQFPTWVHEIYTALPVKGGTYTIREVAPGRGIFVVIGEDGQPVRDGGGDRQPEIQILLAELHNPPDPQCPGREIGFRSERFAPMEEIEQENEEVEEFAFPVGIPVKIETGMN
jgi:hypothetical protein